MCDTMVALPPATLSGGTLFAKNSDRERNEAQWLDDAPRARHHPGERLRCTYIDIPQVAETHAVLLSRPFWCWGAEIGANEHGLVIGNEAVFANVPPAREPALIGMDLVRLGLERAAGAAEALDVITTLLEQHGQGGNCGHLHEHFYDNGFLIADRKEAFVLETVGRMWAVERVGDLRSISNALSIGRGKVWRSGGGLLAHAQAAGLCTGLEDLDFAEAYLDPEREAMTRGRLRCGRSDSVLRRSAPQLEAAHMKAALRDHGAAAEGEVHWHPAHTQGRTICMHAGADARRSQTTASMVSELRADGRVVHWVTASAAPCLSVFKPVLPGIALPEHGPRPDDRYNASTLWWQHERLHRAAERGDFPALLADWQSSQLALEARFRERIESALSESPQQQALAVADCWSEAALLQQQRLRDLPDMVDADKDHAESWRALDALAGLPASG